MCCGGYGSQISNEQTEKPHKKNKKGKKMTFQMIEDQLEHMANCFEAKRQERIAKIPTQVAQCVKVTPCCTPRPNCVDVFYDRFLKELTADNKIRRRIMVKSACRMPPELKQLYGDTKPPLPCPPPSACKTFRCPPKQCSQRQNQNVPNNKSSNGTLQSKTAFRQSATAPAKPNQQNVPNNKSSNGTLQSKTTIRQSATAPAKPVGMRNQGPQPGGSSSRSKVKSAKARNIPSGETFNKGVGSRGSGCPCHNSSATSVNSCQEGAVKRKVDFESCFDTHQCR